MDYEKEIQRLESERDVLRNRMAEYQQTVANIQTELLKLEGEHRFCVRQLSQDKEMEDDTKTGDITGENGDTDARSI